MTQLLLLPGLSLTTADPSTTELKFRIADRLAIFGALFLLSSIMISVEIKEFVKSIVNTNGLFAFAWTGMLGCFSMYLGSIRWRNRSWPFKSMVFVALVCGGLYFVVTNETYQVTRIPGGVEVTREYWVIQTLILAAILIALSKSIGIVSAAFSKRTSKWWLMAKQQSRPRKLIGILATLFVLHFVQQAIATAMPSELDLDWNLDYEFDSNWFWFIFLPGIVFLPPFLIRTLVKSWWQRMIWLTIFGLAFFFRETFAGLEFPSLFQLFNNDLHFFLAALWICYYVGLIQIVPTRDYISVSPRNRMTGLVGSAIAIGSVAFLLNFNLPTLVKWHDSTRWELAHAMSVFTPFPNVEFKIQMDGEGEDFDQWVEATHNVGPQDDYDSLDALPDFYGVLRIKNLRTNLETGNLQDLENASLELVHGEVSTSQIQAMIGNNRNYGAFLELVDVKIENDQKTHWPVFDWAGIVFESNSLAITQSLLLALESKSMPVPSVGLHLNHDLDKTEWKRLIDVSHSLPTSILLSLYLEDLQLHGNAHRNLPLDSKLKGLIFLGATDPGPQIFSNDQLRHIIHGQTRIEFADRDPWNPAPITTPQYQTAFDIGFASTCFRSLTIQKQSLIKLFLESNFELADDYHWIFRPSEKTPNAPIKGMALPFTSLEALQFVAKRTPDLEVLCLGDGLLRPLHFTSSHDEDEMVSIRPISRLKALKELMISDYSQFSSMDSLSKLENLKSLYMYSDNEDLSWISQLKHLETLVLEPPYEWEDDEGDDVLAGRFGFRATKDSQLKSIALTNMPTGNLIREIAKLPRLERLSIVIDDLSYPEEALEARQTARKLFANVKFISEEDFEAPIPEAYREHLVRVRKQVRQKYLGITNGSFESGVKRD